MIKEIQIKVRGYHLDGYQHVNNARYLEFLEEARWAYFEDNDAIKKLQAQNIYFVIVNINIDYKYPASLGDTVVLKSKLTSLGNKKSTFRQTAYLNGTNIEVVDATITFVLLDAKTQKAIPISDEIREWFEAYVVAE